MRDRLIELINNRICATKIEVERIADYLLDNGVIVPPCEVGTDIYTIDNGEVKRLYVMGVSKHNNGNIYIQYVTYDIKGAPDLNWITSRCTDRDIGKTVFLTREEAEKALKEGAKQ